MAGVFEGALASIGAAITDVREKVAEEAWWGRVVTDGQGVAPESGAAPAAVTMTDENPEIICLFDEKLSTIISAPCDPDIQPHGQVVDR